MYVNDVWTVGEVWNYQNIPKSKHSSSGFLSNLFGKSDRRLHVQNNILSQQLTESQQGRKEIERTLREVTMSHQQEIQHSNARLQETQTQLQESDTKLQETQFQLQELDSRLLETQSQLQETQFHLQVSDTRLRETQVQLQHAQENFQDSQQRTQVLIC